MSKGGSGRSHFIPLRKADLCAAIVADLPATIRPADWTQLCRMLSAIFHYDYFAELERLHAAYYHLDPSQPAGRLGAAETEAAYAELSGAMDRVLKGANFVEVTPEKIAAAEQESGKIKYRVRNALSDFRAVRLFSRGQHTEPFVRKSLFGFRKTALVLDVYDEVVLLAAAKTTVPETGRRRKRPTSRPGSVAIKLFHDIPCADIDALYPDVRVVMTLTDQLMLGLPALVGGIPLLIKLAPALLVVLALVRFYAGDPQPGGNDGVSEALIVAGGIIALGGFLMQQWVKYERRALRYQKEVNDLIYFHNVTNNVGLFDHLIGIAEEQEFKEALLGYFFLLTAGPMNRDALDSRVEAWLAEHAGVDIDFELDDALAKLDRFGILQSRGEQLSVLPLPAALRALDRRWDGIFEAASEEGDQPARNAAAE